MSVFDFITDYFQDDEPAPQADQSAEPDMVDRVVSVARSGLDAAEGLGNYFRTTGGEQQQRVNQSAEPDMVDYAVSVGQGFNPFAIARSGRAAGADIVNYFRTSTPGEVWEDVQDAGSAVVDYATENPLEALADVTPVVGDIKGYLEDIQEASDLRAQGRYSEASRIAGGALALAAMGVVPGVGEARKTGRVARAAGAAENPTPTAARTSTGSARAADTPENSLPQVSAETAANMYQTTAARRNLMQYVSDPDQLSRANRRSVENYLRRVQNEDSPWAARERMRLSGQTDVEINRPERNIVSPEDMQGETLLPIMGDMSIGGGTLHSVQGIPLSRPVNLEGGPYYPFFREGIGWASMETAARNKQTHINKAAQGTGQSPLAVYTSMGPLAMDFNSMQAEAALRMLPNLNARPEAIEAFNAAIRGGHGGRSGFRGIPEFPGILDEDALAMVRNEVPTTSSTNAYLRQSLGAAFRRAEFQKQGLPVQQDIVRAINEPELVGDPVGMSGFSFFRGVPGADVIPGDHTTYSHTIARQGSGGTQGANQGLNVGGLDYTVPPEIMFPKSWAEISRGVDKNGNPLTNQMRVGALQSGHYYEVADQQWVDTNMRYQEEVRAARDAAGLLEE